MRPSSKDDDDLNRCNDILIDLSLGKMKSDQKEGSLYKNILLQNLLNRRLQEKVEGIPCSKKRLQEMRFILLFNRNRDTDMCEPAPWSNAGEEVDNDDVDDDDEMMEERASNTDTQPGQARLRIRLVVKEKSPKRQREVVEGKDLNGGVNLKRRCGEHYFADSPQPLEVV